MNVNAIVDKISQKIEENEIKKKINKYCSKCTENDDYIVINIYETNIVKSYCIHDIISFIKISNNYIRFHIEVLDKNNHFCGECENKFVSFNTLHIKEDNKKAKIFIKDNGYRTRENYFCVECFTKILFFSLFPSRN